jgi:hypothetical protein
MFLKKYCGFLYLILGGDKTRIIFSFYKEKQMFQRLLYGISWQFYTYF